MGISQRDLADRAGVDLKTVYNLISGERWPQAKTRGAIENVLGWRPGDLLRIAEGGVPGSAVVLRSEVALPELGRLIEDHRAASGQSIEDAADKAGLEPERWPTMLTLANPQGYEIVTLARMAGAVGLYSGVLFGINDEVADELLGIETTAAGHEMQEDLRASQDMIDEAKRKLSALPGEQFQLVKKLIDELHKGA
jgi:hypothetical protein